MNKTETEKKTKNENENRSNKFPKYRSSYHSMNRQSKLFDKL